jgi:hypothetical protein
MMVRSSGQEALVEVGSTLFPPTEVDYSLAIRAKRAPSSARVTTPDMVDERRNCRG